MTGSGFPRLVSRAPVGSRDGQQTTKLRAGPKLRILLADGNRVSQRVLAKVLERAGHEIAIVGNEEQVLDALERSEAFDLALIDIDLPVIAGIEAAKLYRFMSLGQKQVPIVGLTTDTTPEAPKRCAQAGINICLVKPVNAALLLTVVRQVVSDEDPTPQSVSGWHSPLRQLITPAPTDPKAPYPSGS